MKFEENRFRRLAWALVLWGTLLAAAFPQQGRAAERKFLGYDVEPLAGTYEITTDANVRAGPMTEAKRVTGLSQGTRVEVVGKAKGAWIAIRWDGQDLGFVYEPLLKAVDLPPLERDAQGRIIDDEGNPISPASGFYVAASDVNLRAKPSTQAPKRGDIERGTEIEAIGSARDGEWLAVRKDDQELGFVFAEILLPLIDGELDAPVEGKTAAGGDVSCSYKIRFSGKNPVEGELFETSDYDIDWACDVDGKEVDFPAFMFITEAPFQLSDNDVYQISIDLLGVVREYDEIFSTVFLYRRDEGRVVFDSVSMDDFGKTPGTAEMRASSVAEALSAAASLAPEAWDRKVWDMLGQNNN